MAYLKRAFELPDETGGSAVLPDSALDRDPQTERFRRNLNLGRSLANETLVNQALGFAKQTEARIAELNARIRHLEALTQTDELTGLLNRRGFGEIIRRNLSSAARYDETGLLAYIDLNGFKEVNDRFGHNVGDEVLRTVGAYIAKGIRSTDYAARLGGDEFAILFVRAEHKRARERARELVRGVSELEVRCKGTVISVSASLGLAAYSGDTDAESLIERADRAMYADKQHGGRAARLTTNG
ncbi:GGDEF domain-containing protein [Parvibaculum sp.]|uniref:GGDEF domain-containing protein n=1 Tax=Parvibaculum sp. TaxID=2024848 RepID=UPI00391A065E